MHHAAEFYEYLIFSALGVLSISVAWYRRRRQGFPASILPAIVLFVFCGIQLTTLFDRLCPSPLNTFDLYLYFADGSFGVQTSVWLNQKIGYGGFGKCLEVIYAAWPLAIGWTCAALTLRGRKVERIVAVFMFSSVVGVFCYSLLPACGPAPLLGGTFSFSDPFTTTASLNPGAVPMELQYRRNCMPSLHMTWALLVAWLCRGFRRGRWVAVAFAILTGVAAVWNGEHYLVDIIGAFPFALTLYQGCMGKLPFSNPQRLLRFMGGVCTFLLWVMVIRFYSYLLWASPIIPWTIAFLIIAGTLAAIHEEQDKQPIKSEEHEPKYALAEV